MGQMNKFLYNGIVCPLGALPFLILLPFLRCSDLSFANAIRCSGGWDASYVWRARAMQISGIYFLGFSFSPPSRQQNTITMIRPLL